MINKKGDNLSMKKIMPLFFSVFVSFLINSIFVFGQSPSRLTAEFDKIISSEIKSEEPGGVVLIAQKDKVIYKKAFGLANIELNAPMKEEMVFNFPIL